MDERFLYHSNAVAFGGRVMRPFSEVMEAQAAVVLPITGGHGQARVDDYRYRDVVSFAAAHSTVTGNQSRRADGTVVHNSLATTTVEGLNIANVVTADVVVARLVSEQIGKQDPLPLLPVGSHFVNLRIAGFRVDPQPHEVLFQTGTLAELADACPKQKRPPVAPDGLPVQIDGKQSPRTPAKAGAPSTYQEQRLLTSLFELPAALPPGCGTKDSCGIVVPGFGTVFLGEFLITRYSRRLTMLRVEMGSPVEGEASISAVEGNGSPYP